MTFRIALCVVLFAAQSAGARQAVPPFDAGAVGQPPRGFTFAEARGATAGRWTVERQGEALILAHTAAASGVDGAALAVIEGADHETFEASVRLRLPAGRRTAGLVWRYADPENYHFVELNLAEQRLDAYRVVRGNHVRFESEDDLELDPDAWYALKVVQDRARVRVYLGGIRVLEERRRADAVPGRVGVWSSGGSTAWFDDLTVGPTRSRRDEDSDR